MDLAHRSDRIAMAYARVVPMGQALAKAEAETKAPNSGNLDRIQIIKGWTEDGASREKIYNVALSDERVSATDGNALPVGNTVDVRRASYTNEIGDAELSAVWEDPDFEPFTPAFYYVRALETPTPGWTTHDAAAHGTELPNGVPARIQERAYTSPIWYQP